MGKHKLRQGICKALTMLSIKMAASMQSIQLPIQQLCFGLKWATIFGRVCNLFIISELFITQYQTFYYMFSCSVKAIVRSCAVYCKVVDDIILKQVFVSILHVLLCNSFQCKQFQQCVCIMNVTILRILFVRILKTPKSSFSIVLFACLLNCDQLC